MGPLFFLFVVLPLADLLLLVHLGRVVGALNTLTFVLATGLLGAALMRNQGRRVLGELREAQAQGRVPEEGVVGGLLVLVGGLLLIAPGVLTDVLGLLCLFPPTRRALCRALAQSFARKMAEGQLRVQVQDAGTVWRRGPPAGPGYAPPAAARMPHDPRARSIPRPEDVIDTEGEELLQRGLHVQQQSRGVR